MIAYRVVVLMSLLLLTAAAMRAEADVRIENDRYSVGIEAAGGTFSVVAKPSGKTFLTDGKLSSAGGTAKAVALVDKVFGNGKGIGVAYPNGNRESVALYPGVPFVLFRSTLHNGTAEPIVLNHVPTVSAGVDIGKPLAEIRTLGTGGLLESGEESRQLRLSGRGRSADPQRRRCRLADPRPRQRRGLLARRGRYGPRCRRSSITAGCGSSPARTPPPRPSPSATSTTPGWAWKRMPTPSPRSTPSNCRRSRPGYCTWYMEKHGGACDEKHLAELSRVRRKEPQAVRLRFHPDRRRLAGGHPHQRPEEELHHARRPTAPIPAA